MQGFLNIAFSNFCSLAYSFYLYSFFYFYYYFRTSITHRLSEESTYFFSINLISIVLLCIQILTKRGNRTRLAFYCLNFELLSSLSSQAPLFFLFLFLLSRFKRTKNPWFWDKLYIEYFRITNDLLNELMGILSWDYNCCAASRALSIHVFYFVFIGNLEKELWGYDCRFQ